LVPKLLREPSQQLATPDIRVCSAFGIIVDVEHRDTAYPALRISVENHSARPLFLASIALEGEGCRAGPFIDAYRQRINEERTIEPGDGLHANIRMMSGIEQLEWRDFVAIDKIGRRFAADHSEFGANFANWRSWLKEHPASNWDLFGGRAGCYFQEIVSLSGGDNSCHAPVSSRPPDISKPAIPAEKVNLSQEANDYLDVLAEAYVKAGFPNHKVWKFDKGKNGTLHNQLRAHGIIEMMGTRGASWRLTDRGHRLVLALSNDPKGLVPTND
jgi:hypothetical protein